MSNKYQEWLDRIFTNEQYYTSSGEWEWDDWSHNSWNQALIEALEILEKYVDYDGDRVDQAIKEIKKLTT